MWPLNVGGAYHRTGQCSCCIIQQLSALTALRGGLTVGMIYRKCHVLGIGIPRVCALLVNPELLLVLVPSKPVPDSRLRVAAAPDFGNGSLESHAEHPPLLPTELSVLHVQHCGWS